jgi:hypothetical protein
MAERQHNAPLAGLAQEQGDASVTFETIDLHR